MFLKNALLVFYLFLILTAWSQNQPGSELHVREASSEIEIDGQLNEPDWQSAHVASDFFLNFPVDSIRPDFQSEVRLTFNDQFFFIGIVCYDDAKPNVVQSLRRDFDFESNDGFGVFIDPYNDNTNGFFFMITPYGVQGEGVIQEGGLNSGSYNGSWDNKWYSQVTRLDDRWVAEIAIPFKSFRYNDDVANWNIAFVRNDLKRNQVSGWIRTPIQYIPSSFAYAGKLMWDERPPKAGVNISLIPYVAGSAAHEKSQGTEIEKNIGLDAKVAITPSINLDLTVNPDFSNVEVDRQVINLTRFEFRFPERRQFFLENNDLFATPGFPHTRPFFTRRLGLATDSLGSIKKVPILYGARISGKIGSEWRVGLLNLHTNDQESLGLPDQNYTVAVVQRQIFSRSNIDIVYIGKENLGLGQYNSKKYYHNSLLHEVDNNGETDTVLNHYNRLVGVDFNLFTKTNRWNGDIYYYQSFDEINTDEKYSFGYYFGYTSRNLRVRTSQNRMGKNYNAEAGFVPGLQVYPGFHDVMFRVENPMYPKSNRIIVLTPGYGIEANLTPDGKLTDRTLSVDFGIDFKNTAGFGISYNRILQVMTGDFNPISGANELFLEGEEYEWNEFAVGYNSDSRKLFRWDAGFLFGSFYNGERYNINGSLSYRYQPFGSITVNLDYNDIRLPGDYGSAKYLLVSPRIDLTFTDALFFTTFIQYNDRADNVNLNTRFQWRFAPASDLFIVYTENYLPGSFSSKNRALVLKLTYWFNI